MTYEFNPDSQIFEFPNPYKVENLALIVSGVIMLAAGTATMWGVRERIGQALDLRTLAVLAISIGLLLCGMAFCARAFTQLRYFFGRNRPENLAPVVPQGSDGDSNSAAHYKETLRQNALVFEEPKGALNGLLYSWLPHLIFAPRFVQHTAQTQFYNFLALAATLLSFLMCWLMFGRGATSGWIGLAYAGFVFYQIVRPMMQSGPESAPPTGTAHVGTGGLIVLIVLAMLGPVVLGMVAPQLPDLGTLTINAALLVALLCVLAGSVVFGLALKNQLQPAPQAVGAARVAETITMNAHPNKLIEELDRILMTRWYNRIPNRRYARHSPAINGQQGQFTAEIFEETQPRPQPNRTADDVSHALSAAPFRWLAILTGLALVYCATGALAALLATRQILGGEPVSTTIALALSQIMAGIFCFHAAHRLWGRFDFISTLVWVDIQGSFESARMNIGNQIAGNVQTSKSVINIEAMTMRVWVSEIDTVIFGKDSARQVIGMRGLQAVADELASGLKMFGESRSMVIAPTSAEDMARTQKIGVVNKLIETPALPDSMKAAVAVAYGAGMGETQSGTAGPGAGKSLNASCRACGASAAPGARFCIECGAPLTP